jgi:hypothetical protein
VERAEVLFGRRLMVAAIKAVGIAPLHFLIIGGRLAGVVIKLLRHFAADVTEPSQPVVLFRFHRLSHAKEGIIYYNIYTFTGANSLSP